MRKKFIVSSKQNLMRVINGQFLIPGYRTPYRFDRNPTGCGIMLCLAEYYSIKISQGRAASCRSLVLDLT